jgi:hypothetical protein
LFIRILALCCSSSSRESNFAPQITHLYNSFGRSISRSIRSSYSEGESATNSQRLSIELLILASLHGKAFDSFGITDCLLATKANARATDDPDELIKDLVLQENADVFCCQVGLIQDDLPSSNLEVVVVPAQQVMTGTNEKILVLLHTGSIAQKIRLNFDL